MVSIFFTIGKFFSKLQGKTSSDGSSANQTTSDGGGSGTFRLRKGEWNCTKEILSLILSLMVSFSMTNSNFWT